MAGSIKSGWFGSQPSVQWELFYGDNNNWTLYGYKEAGYAFYNNVGVPGSWDVTITLGTGQSTTVTIYPNFNVSAYDEFYVDFSFTTPATSTAINVKATSSVFSSSGIGSFSGNYIVNTPTPPPTPTSTFDIQNVIVTATANSNFTWSFNVTMVVIQDIYTTLGGSVSITTNGMTFTEVSGSRNIKKEDYVTGKYKYTYQFTATGGNASTIKSLYSASPSSPQLSLSLSLSMKSQMNYNGSITSTYRSASAETTIKIVTPAPVASSGWFSYRVNNSASGGSDAFQYYIKGKSRVRVTFDKSKINIANLCGATIAKCKASINGTSYSSANASTVIAFDTNVLTVAGNLTLTAAVIDTRGTEYALGSVTITVYDYAEPTLSNISAFRCNGPGHQDDKGIFLYLMAKALPASVGGHNTVSLKARYKPTSGSYGDYRNLPNNLATITGGDLSTTSAYIVEIVATDTAGFSAVYTAFIPTEIAIFSVKNGGKAVGVGMFVDGEEDYTYHVAFTTYLHKDMILGETRLTEEDLIKLLALIKEG